MRIISSGLYKLALSLGARPRKAERLLASGRYADSLAAWKKSGGTITKTYKILDDFGESAGVARGHYFHQDLLVAKLINDAAPERHIDIGSRIDGFVAHVAAFRPIEIIDIRPLGNVVHNNMSFIQHDLMTTPGNDLKTDSISCLHAIEHFGLGRYGDPVDPEGHLKGFENIVSMLRPGGQLYISFPIADQDEVHFNAHRIFSPTSIYNWPSADKLCLKRFDYVGDDGELYMNKQPDQLPQGIQYGCGIYSFEKH